MFHIEKLLRKAKTLILVPQVACFRIMRKFAPFENFPLYGICTSYDVSGCSLKEYPPKLQQRHGKPC